MPTMCASYPLTTELQLSDFWHVRTMFWKKGPKNKLAPAWQAEEDYVVVEAPACEGFHVNKVELKNMLTPIRHGELVECNDTIVASNYVDTTAYSVSIRDFIQGDSDISSKWEETQWFMQLVEEVAAALPVESLPNKQIEQLYVNTLALIWYNFDKLSCGHSRPFKSYKRLKADISQITWLLVNQTIAHITTFDDPSSGSYTSLVERLNISVK